MKRFFRPISAFVICKNKAQFIGGCLESLDFCREIIVVDSGSTDGTLDVIRRYIAEGFPIRLFEREWPGYAPQKQFALDQCTQPWCINLDADERLDDDLRATLSKMELNEQTPARCAFPLRDYLPGYGYPPRLVHAKPLVRMIRRGETRYDESVLVHESLRLGGPATTIRPGALLHYRNISISREAEKMNQYAALKARERYARGARSSYLALIFRPIGHFIKIYYGQRYLICGKAGFIYAFMLAQYTFLTEAKLFRLALGDEAPEE